MVSTAVTLCFFLLGVIRFQQAIPDGSKDWIDYYNGQEVVLEGLVVQSPDVTSKRTQLTVEPARISFPDDFFSDNFASDSEINNKRYDQLPYHTKPKGRILVTGRGASDNKYRYGDVVRIIDELEEPPELEDFSYREYLSVKGIYSVISFPVDIEVVDREQGSAIFSFLYRIREVLCERLERFFPEPHASLLAGIILGVKRQYSDFFYEAMRRTSVLHVIVASGVNITIVMNSVAVAMAGMGMRRWWQMPILAIALFSYAAIAGFEPPIVRALITGAITYVALVSGRRKHGLLALLVAAAAMLFFAPLLYKGLGFQLSFGASAALLLIYPHFKSGFSFLPYKLEESLESTLAVQLALVPFLMYKFATFSIVAPLVNMLVLPAIEGLMLAGFVWLLISFTFPAAIVSLLSWIIYLFVEFFVQVVNYFGHLSWASIEGVKMSLWMVSAYYVALVVALWKLSRYRKGEAGDAS